MSFLRFDSSNFAPECIITPFPPRTWRDLWRVEFSVKDVVGVLATVLRIFDTLSIRVLYSESSTYFSDRYSTASFIIDCQGYHSEKDLSSDERAVEDRAELVDLQTILSAELADILVFPDNKSPRLKVKRLLSYYHHHRHFSQVEKTGKETIRDGSVVICAEFRRRLYSSFGRKTGIGAVVITDTKDRICRVRFYPVNSGVSWMRVTCPDTPGVLGKIIRKTMDCQVNILKTQIRSNLAHNEKENATCVIDLLVVSKIPGDKKLSSRKLVETMRKMISKDSTLCGLEIAVDAPLN